MSNDTPKTRLRLGAFYRSGRSLYDILLRNNANNNIIILEDAHRKNPS